jgi:hypothetical protein
MKRHQPVGDLLARKAHPGLFHDPFGQADRPLQTSDGAGPPSPGDPRSAGAGPAGLGQDPLGLGDRGPDLLGGLQGQAAHLGLGVAGAPPQGAAKRPQPLADSPTAVLDPPGHGRHGRPDLPGAAGKHAYRVGGQAGVGGVADVGLGHGGV